MTEAFIFQRLSLDQTSNINPLTLLENVTSNGVSQSICVNDLGTIYMHIVTPPFLSQEDNIFKFQDSAFSVLPSRTYIFYTF